MTLLIFFFGVSLRHWRAQDFLARSRKLSSCLCMCQWVCNRALTSLWLPSSISLMSHDNNFLARRGFLIKTLMCLCLLSAICNNLKGIQLMIPSSLLSSYYILRFAVVPEFLYFCVMSCGNSIRIYGIKCMEYKCVLKSLVPPHFSRLALRNAAGTCSKTLLILKDTLPF